MLAKCSNPDCDAPFNHREGRLVRRRALTREGGTAQNHHGVEHFWLCAKCAKLYAFQDEHGSAMRIRPRAKTAHETIARRLCVMV